MSFMYLNVISHASFVPNSQTRSSPHTRHEREPYLVRRISHASLARSLPYPRRPDFTPFSPPGSPGAAVHSPALHPPGFSLFSADPSRNSATVAGNVGTDGVLNDLARRRPIDGEFINFIMISISMVTS
ncbi:unnamed protein product [Vicia faba]|uniref:Uncharacterized protein n=1 Tax=Vicia faba TaxID=3906 RepID=A0AAV1AS20_VICFA|nr:unnamed protein product [Vicia faba]